jgi:hypothetical protein
VYGCGTWFFTLREHRLEVFKDKVLRRMHGPMREKMVGVWRKLNNEELHNLYSPPIKIRAIDQEYEIGRTCSTYVEERGRSGMQIGIWWNSHRERDH